jgi:catechol 2,3-dioxygenase-like lactoylglutathione lyase family enzyme
MKQTTGYVALVVRDYDEALRFYVETLGFVLIEDTFVAAQNKRWGWRRHPARLSLDCYSYERSARSRSHASATRAADA